MSVRVLTTADDIDVASELGRLEAMGGGGVASFTGVVRGDGSLAALTLETHERMAARALEAIAGEAMRRWPLLGVTLIHRHGRLPIGSRIVLVATASRHRAAALEACAFLIDWAKTKAPYWKREERADGGGAWIEPRDADEAAARAWG